ncbi:fec operon regulator FecR [compost metagenome]
MGAWTIYQFVTPVAYTAVMAGNKVMTRTLPDGSELTLNKKTQLSYASNFKNNRSIRLDSGDVFFNVAHDKSHPFVIEIDEVSVEVVGTSFNVKHVNSQTEVIVE